MLTKSMAEILIIDKLLKSQIIQEWQTNVRVFCFLAAVLYHIIYFGVSWTKKI